MCLRAVLSCRLSRACVVRSTSDVHVEHARHIPPGRRTRRFAVASEPRRAFAGGRVRARARLTADGEDIRFDTIVGSSRRVPIPPWRPCAVGTRPRAPPARPIGSSTMLRVARAGRGRSRCFSPGAHCTSCFAVNRGGVHLGRKLPVFVCQSLGFLMGPCARALAPGRAMEGQAGTASAPAPPRRSAATA